MVRAVLDANVYVSAALHPAGPPGRILERFIRDRAFALIASPAIADESYHAATNPSRLMPIHHEHGSVGKRGIFAV